MIIFKIDILIKNFCPRLCPGKTCLNILKSSEGDDLKAVQCKCGVEFCFDCGNSPHEPANCQVVQKWDEEINASSDYQLQLYARKCPVCSGTVFDDGTAKYEDCTNFHECGIHFCWYCLDTTGSHLECDLKKDWDNYELMFLMINER